MTEAERTVGFLLPYPGGDGSWIDGALAAASRLGAAVEFGMPAVLPPWDVVVCHGIQYEALVRAARAGGAGGGGADVGGAGLGGAGLGAARVGGARAGGAGGDASSGWPQTVILSDVPFDRDGLEGVTCVDWAWNAGAYCAGAVAAAVSDGRPVGLIAGPPVRTQVRLAYAFARGLARAAEHGGAPAPELVTVHLRAFDAVAEGAAAGEHLATTLGCAVVAHTADSAGAAGLSRAAAAAGAATLGFVGEHPGPPGPPAATAASAPAATVDGDDSRGSGHLAVIRSDIAGVLERLARAALAGEPLPALHTCSFEAGDLGLDFAPEPPHAALAAARAAAHDVTTGSAHLV